MNTDPGEAPGREPGPVTAVAPDLIGLDLHDACEAAAWAGTRIDATRVVRGRGPWGVVVAQSPSPGVRLRSRWQIHVLIAAPLPANEPEDD